MRRQLYDGHGPGPPSFTPPTVPTPQVISTPSVATTISDTLTQYVSSSITRTTLSPDIYDSLGPPPLTTIFIPPSQCTIPMIDMVNNSCSENLCRATFAPFVATQWMLDEDESPIALVASCVPSYTANADGLLVGITSYSPGFFCPSGMVIATYISGSNQAICCPSGLSILGSQTSQCIGTMTEGSFLLGLIFTTYLSNSQGLDTILGADYASLSATSSYESQSNLTFIVTADPILLASPKLSVVKAATTTIAPNNSASAPRPNNGNGNGNGATNSGTSQVSRSNAIRQATLIGVPIISFAMLVFGILMFVRYRRRQRLLRGLSQELSEGQADEKDTEKSPIDKTTSIWQLKPELDASRAFAELEGTNVEEAGPGIHVSKPELEASLGIAGLVGVYVKYKAELDVPSATG